MIRYTEYDTGLIGTLTLTATADGAALTGCWFENDRFYNGPRTAEMERDDDAPALAQARAWLDRYFAGERPDPFELPLAPQGSDFRQRVWKILLESPYGETMTYGDIAHRLVAQSGGRMSAQAVGGAVGHNEISILIPCHRVVGATGSLTGYAGGIDKKVKLLELERADLRGLFVPKRGTAL